MRSAPRARAASRQAPKACWLAWISANSASRTFSSAIGTGQAWARIDGYQTRATAGPQRGPTQDQGKGNAAWTGNERARQRRSGLARRFQAFEQQRQHSIEPRGNLRVTP